MRRTLKGAVAAIALMLALSSPVFAEGGVNSSTGKGHTSAYTGTGVNKSGTSGYTNRMMEDPATTNFMDNDRNFRRNNVNGDNNGLIDRTVRGTERMVRGTERTVRAAATDNNNDFDWGWLGLLGLIGLAGLRGRNRETGR
ncbi:WGxxGxxG family protein [Thermobacillus composti]|uniref:WGxxGxxG family protein n=1 Tax=Thermobacillus composti TaxID=377615 RepID=UPI0012FC4399|nr:WGxxGxxG family protein [Thermobacillus composti]